MKRFLLILTCFALLAACGGGGGGSDSSEPVTPIIVSDNSTWTGRYNMEYFEITYSGGITVTKADASYFKGEASYRAVPERLILKMQMTLYGETIYAYGDSDYENTDGELNCVSFGTTVLSDTEILVYYNGCYFYGYTASINAELRKVSDSFTVLPNRRY